jgi:hypothetical protein
MKVTSLLAQSSLTISRSVAGTTEPRLRDLYRIREIFGEPFQQRPPASRSSLGSVPGVSRRRLAVRLTARTGVACADPHEPAQAARLADRAVKIRRRHPDDSVTGAPLRSAAELRQPGAGRMRCAAESSW